MHCLMVVAPGARGSNLVSFPFDLLKPKECLALMHNNLSLYEVGIFDMAIYPLGAVV